MDPSSTDGPSTINSGLLSHSCGRAAVKSPGTTSALASGTSSICHMVTGPTCEGFFAVWSNTDSLTVRGVSVRRLQNIVATSNNIFGCTTAPAPTGLQFSSTVSLDVTPGTVTFRSGSTVLGTEPLDADGVARLTVSTLQAGTHQIVADYSGDAVCPPATSNTATATVTAPPRMARSAPTAQPDGKRSASGASGVVRGRAVSIVLSKTVVR